jgi:monovalent cation:H+ antiporter-2, CPA2 family
VIRITREARDQRYSLLRGYFHGADDDTVDELAQARLQSVTLTDTSRCVGRTLAEQNLQDLGVRVVSVRHTTGAVVAPAADRVLAGGDTLVLSGLPEALALAEAQLLRA